MTTLRSFFLLLFHFGCFYMFPDTDPRRKRKTPPPSATSSRLKKAHKALSSSWSSLKFTFSSKFSAATQTQLSDAPLTTKPYEESDISADNLRNDIFPCTMCGEIFPKSQLLEQHQGMKHAVSEMRESDGGKNIVGIIFKVGWTETKKVPEIHRILKIDNTHKILARFEEYREIMKAKASRNGAVKRRDERCIADGNELLRFHCTMFSCDLGQNGNSSLCNHSYCSVCGIIRSGFSPKMDGISTLAGSWRAHVSVPEEVEEEFGFMNVKRAILVCRVGNDSDEAEKGDSGFDSVVGSGGGGPTPDLTMRNCWCSIQGLCFLALSSSTPFG